MSGRPSKVRLRDRLRRKKHAKTDSTTPPSNDEPEKGNTKWVWHPEEWVSYLARDPRGALARSREDFPGKRSDTASIGFVRMFCDTLWDDSGAPEFVSPSLEWRRTSPIGDRLHRPGPRYVVSDSSKDTDLALVNASGKTIPALVDIGRETTRYVSRVSHPPEAFGDFMTQTLKRSLRYQSPLEYPSWVSPHVALALALLHDKSSICSLTDYPARATLRESPEDSAQDAYFDANVPTDLGEDAPAGWLRVVREYSIAVHDAARPGRPSALYHAFFPNLGRLRHGCSPNVVLTVRNNLLMLITVREIEPDEEIVWAPYQLGTLGARRSSFVATGELERLCDGCRMSRGMDLAKFELRTHVFSRSRHEALKLAAYACQVVDSVGEDGNPNPFAEICVSACKTVTAACVSGRARSGAQVWKSPLQLAFGPVDEDDDFGDDRELARWESDVLAFLWCDFGDLVLRSLGRVGDDSPDVHTCALEICHLIAQSVCFRRPILPIESEMALRSFMCVLNAAAVLERVRPPSDLFSDDLAHELLALLVALSQAPFSAASDTSNLEIFQARTGPQRKHRVEDSSQIPEALQPHPLSFVTVPVLRDAADRTMKQFRREIYPPLAFRSLAESLVRPNTSPEYTAGLAKLERATAAPHSFFSVDPNLFSYRNAPILSLVQVWRHDFDAGRTRPTWESSHEAKAGTLAHFLPLARLLGLFAVVVDDAANRSIDSIDSSLGTPDPD